MLEFVDYGFVFYFEAKFPKGSIQKEVPDVVLIGYEGDENNDEEYLEIPSNVSDNEGFEYIVAEIGYKSLIDCDAKEVEIPETCVHLSNTAFRKGVKVVIPETNPYLFQLGDYVFKIGGVNEVIINGYKGNEIELTLPSKIEYKGQEYSVTSIGEDAFYECDNLERVVLSNATFYIEEYAFRNSNVKEVIIAKDCAIRSNIAWLKNIKVVIEENSSLFQTDDYVFDIISENEVRINGYKSKNAEVVIPSKVEYKGKEYIVASLGCEAFGGYNLISVIIPNSVTEIGNGAFNNCVNLERVIVGDSVNVIGERAFYECKKLNSLVLGNNVAKIGYGAFDGCKNLKSVVLPDSVTEICNGAFYSCENLESVIIPNNVTSIGDFAFFRCENLNSVAISDSVAFIGYEAFYGCVNLKSVIMGNGVKTIETRAFYQCFKLRTITIPKNAKIENNTFMVENIEIIRI